MNVNSSPEEDILAVLDNPSDADAVMGIKILLAGMEGNAGIPWRWLWTLVQNLL